MPKCGNNQANNYKATLLFALIALMDNFVAYRRYED